MKTRGHTRTWLELYSGELISSRKIRASKALLSGLLRKERNKSDAKEKHQHICVQLRCWLFQSVVCGFQEQQPCVKWSISFHCHFREQHHFFSFLLQFHSGFLLFCWGFFFQKESDKKPGQELGSILLTLNPCQAVLFCDASKNTLLEWHNSLAESARRKIHAKFVIILIFKLCGVSAHFWSGHDFFRIHEEKLIFSSALLSKHVVCYRTTLLSETKTKRPDYLQTLHSVVVNHSNVEKYAFQWRWT